MKQILAVARKELKHILRDPRALILTFMVPLVQLILLGYALSFDIKNLNVAVVDNAKTAFSASLKERFIASPYFIYKGETNRDEAYDLLESGKVDVVLFISKDFRQGPEALEKIQLVIDGSDPLKGRSALNYGTGIIQSIFSKLAGDRVTPLRFRVLYNPEMKSSAFIVPGLIAIIMTVISSVEVALAFAREKEAGTFTRLMLTPLGAFEIITGKLLPYLGFALINASVVVVSGILFFGVPLRGSPWSLLLGALIFLFSTMSLGIIVGALTESVQVALMAGYLVTTLPGIFLSGFVFPVESLPAFLRLISSLIPATYFLRYMRGIFLKGLGVSDLLPELIIMFVFGLVLTAVAGFYLRRNLKGWSQ